MKQHFLITIDTNEEVHQDEIMYFLKTGINNEIDHSSYKSPDYDYLHQLRVVDVISQDEEPTPHAPHDILHRQMRDKDTQTSKEEEE